jgi:triphosphatase
LNGTEQHEVRIAAKKLRYASEFFSSLFEDGKGKHPRNKQFQRRLSRLQDELGLRNDFRVAQGHLAELAAGAGASAAEAAGIASGFLLEQSRRGKRRLMRRWKSFRKATVPRIASDG